MQSLKELYRIGMGPSSSHTLAPRRAAENFRNAFPGAACYRVTLYGSLAATGKGHFTDKAVQDALDPEKTEICWKPNVILPQHPNGMLLEAFSSAGNLLASRTVFSVGGGALQTDGEPPEITDRYPQKNFAQMVEWAEQEGRPLWALSKEFDDSDLFEYLGIVWEQMRKTIKTGLNREDVLPGGLRLMRKAAAVYAKARTQKKNFARTGLVSAYALATSEENASCGTVVTAPTCGSCGILPAVLYYLSEENQCSAMQILGAIAVAGLVGNCAKHNASISGAEVGCQGEVGVACAMAAAAAAQLLGGTPPQIEYAAEIGLEHFLGLTCDPVMGLVQIPCIERNALAANKALIAAEYALLSDGRHRVTFDEVVKAMKQTGHDLPALYRETAEGGLAAVISC